MLLRNCLRIWISDGRFQGLGSQVCLIHMQIWPSLPFVTRQEKDMDEIGAQNPRNSKYSKVKLAVCHPVYAHGFPFLTNFFCKEVISFITSIASITNPGQFINSQLYHSIIFPAFELLLLKKLCQIDRHIYIYLYIQDCMCKANTHHHQHRASTVHFIEHLSWSLPSRILQFDYGGRRGWISTKYP